MKVNASAVLGFFTICVVTLMPSVATAWQYTLAGPGFSDDRFFAVTVDRRGDVYAAGWADTTTCSRHRPFTVVKVSGETGKPIWIQQFCGSMSQAGSLYANGAQWLASDPRGETLASGHIENSDGFVGTIVQLDSTTGAETWRATPAPVVAFIAMDPTGDLAVGASGSIYQAPDSVIKLSGKDGSILWRKGIAAAGQTSLVLGLAADASGDFLAVGTVFKPSSPSHTPSHAALKLSGRNGSEIWRYESDESDANQVTLNSAGDVILAGGTLLGKTFLTKLDGISGGLQWTTAPGTLLTTAVRSIATTRKGDVLLGGTIGRDFIVEKVSGQDGSELWQQSLRGACFDDTIPCHGRANSVATDPAGDAFGAGGAAPDPASDRRAFAVVKFSGETGEMLWSRFLNETNPASNDLAQAMAITPDGDVVAAGWVGNLITEVDAVIVKLDGRTGADYKPSRLRMLDALLSELRVLHLPPGIHSSLEAKLIAARRTLEKSPSGGASANALTEFVHEVHAESGKKIDAADSARLVAAAQEIKDVLTAAP